MEAGLPFIPNVQVVMDQVDVQVATDEDINSILTQDMMILVQVAEEKEAVPFAMEEVNYNSIPSFR